MSKLIDILKEVKTKTFEEFLAHAEILPGHDLSEGSFDLLKIKDILYKTIDRIAEREFKREFER